jgi:hypothetical protein
MLAWRHVIVMFVVTLGYLFGVKKWRGVMLASRKCHIYGHFVLRHANNPGLLFWVKKWRGIMLAWRHVSVTLASCLWLPWAWATYLG